MISTIILILLILQSTIGVIAKSKYQRAQIFQVAVGLLGLITFNPLLGIVLWLLVAVIAAIEEIEKSP